MRTLDLHDGDVCYGLYKGRLACVISPVVIGEPSNIRLVVVFKDISPKRCVHYATKRKCLKKLYRTSLDFVWRSNAISGNKVVYISNKQLKDMSHPYAYFYCVKDVRNLVFDGKIGTRYEYSHKGCSGIGDYFSGLTPTTTKLSPRLRT